MGGANRIFNRKERKDAKEAKTGLSAKLPSRCFGADKLGLFSKIFSRRLHLDHLRNLRILVLRLKESLNSFAISLFGVVWREEGCG
jgi:hypothetical protein